MKNNRKTYEYYPNHTQTRHFRIAQNTDGTYHVSNNRFGFHRNIDGTLEDLLKICDEYSEYGLLFRFF